MSEINYRLFYESPVGWLEIITTDDFVKAVDFWDDKIDADNPNALALEVEKQLEAYFEKRLTSFDLPLKPEGTAFQQKVWCELQNIPFGKTISYLDLSKRIGNEKAIRAVGAANGSNPISIIIPCHRVIGSNGKMVGYGGGIWRKEFLLELEGISMQSELGF